MSKDQLLAEVLSLPPEDRALFAEELLASLEERQEVVEAAWIPELERRARELDEGLVQEIPWETVRAELEQDV